MRWIDHVLKATKDNEAPSSFYYWSSLAAISSVVRKNVFLNRFYYKLYPNTYTFLIAASGGRKGLPIILAKKLVEEVNCTRVVAGRNSIQAVIRDLSKAYSTEDGRVIKDAHGFLVSTELAAFLIKDPDALTILTELYDTHAHEPNWKNSLKQSDTEVLKAPCLTLLGATNESKLSQVIESSDVEGGFIARTFIVYSSDKGKPNPLTEEPENLPDIKNLAHYLKELSQVSGVFKWTDEAKLTYEKWYLKHAPKDHHDPTGTMERIHDSVLKVAMLLSLSEGTELVLLNNHIEEALAVCLQCTTGTKQITMGSGRSVTAYQKKLVLRELIQRPDHRIERSKLLQKFWGELDSYDLDRVIETLVGAGAIEVTGNNKVYILKKSALDEYTEYKIQIQ